MTFPGILDGAVREHPEKRFRYIVPPLPRADRMALVVKDVGDVVIASLLPEDLGQNGALESGVRVALDSGIGQPACLSEVPQALVNQRGTTHGATLP